MPLQLPSATADFNNSCGYFQNDVIRAKPGMPVPTRPCLVWLRGTLVVPDPVARRMPARGAASASGTYTLGAALGALRDRQQAKRQQAGQPGTRDRGTANGAVRHNEPGGQGNAATASHHHLGPSGPLTGGDGKRPVAALHATPCQSQQRVLQGMAWLALRLL